MKSFAVWLLIVLNDHQINMSYFKFCCLGACYFQEYLSEAVGFKTTGNLAFKNGNYHEAIELYDKGLNVCPLQFAEHRSIMFSNRAACLMAKVGVCVFSLPVSMQCVYIVVSNYLFRFTSNNTFCFLHSMFCQLLIIYQFR